MHGLNGILWAAVLALLGGTSEAQVKAVKDCESATVLKATRACVVMEHIGVGAKSGKDVSISKKAASRLDRAIAKLDGMYDLDEVLMAVEEDEGTKGTGLLPDGYTEPVQQDLPGVAEGSSKGEAATEPEEAATEPEAPAVEPRESVADLRVRYQVVAAGGSGVCERGWLTGAMLAERNHPDGERKSALRFLRSKFRAIEAAAAKAAAAITKAGERAEAKKAKVFEAAKAEAVKSEARETAKAERAASSRFAGLFELPEEWPEGGIDEAELRACPSGCGETKPIGDGFGLRRMRSVVYHDTGLFVVDTEQEHEDSGFAGLPIYIKAVRTLVRVQGPCKKCRGRKASA